jgi:hypothetical protein
MGGPAVNIHAKATSSTPAMSSAEWQTRVDLAAVYRLVARHGWDDVIYNHASCLDTAGQMTTFRPLYLLQKPVSALTSQPIGTICH